VAGGAIPLWMRYLSGCFLKLPAPAEEAKPPLRIVKCIVARPCLIATISFLLPVILSVIGWQIVISNSGPDGPFLQLSYPVSDPVAKQSNALILAQEEADTVRISYLGEARRRLSVGEDASAIRRTSTATDPLQSVMRQARLLTAEMADSAASTPQAPFLRHLSGRELQSAGQVRQSEKIVPALSAAALPTVLALWDRHASSLCTPPPPRLFHPLALISDTPPPNTANQVRQTEELATALFAFRAYEEDGDSLSRAGLAEICGLHTTLVTADGYGDYCQRFKVRVAGVLTPGDCQPPVTPLVFFYGPASYDPSSVDLTVFDLRNFEPIALSISERISSRTRTCTAACVTAIRNAVIAETDCTVADFWRVYQLSTTLAYQLLPHWVSSDSNCSAAQLKDIDQVCVASAMKGRAGTGV
jgi:hypothetical protein